MTTSPFQQSARNKWVTLGLIVVAVLLAFSGYGVFAGTLLSLILLASLVRMRGSDMPNRRIVIGLASLAFILNVVFLLRVVGVFGT
ncbi:MAG: hypothetical protein QM589_01305 [Thermomicrobiales bacterium]